MALSRALGLLCVLLPACSRAVRQSEDVHGTAPAALPPTEGGAGDADTDPRGDALADAPDGASGLPPLAPEPFFTNLVAAPFPQAVVSLPNGATSARPLVIVLHGTGDRPDWNCDAWRHITGARGFVLCLRGDDDPRESTPGDPRYTLRGGAHLRAYLEAALVALGSRFDGYVDVGTPIVAGFSLGATEIAELALGDPARFPRVAVLEGGHDVWTDAAARRFARSGGSRVLFGCGSPWCPGPARATARRLEKAGVEARVVFARVGHTNDRPLQEALMTELSWFLEGDPRWQP